MEDWNLCNNILCIRADNMGDLLMSSPAIRALKETFRCKITLLTSAMGQLIAPHIESVDEVIVADLPWIKTRKAVGPNEFLDLVRRLREMHFDAAVIFSVFSQNPLPAAMMAYMASIPRRLAYCRENPYELLTDWVPEKEPYAFIQHQVVRDLNLVKTIGAATPDEKIKISFSKNAPASAFQKIRAAGVDLHQNWLIIHPGVSETKREYPEKDWVTTARLLRDRLNVQVLITGSSADKSLCERIWQKAGTGCFSLAGLLSIEEFIALIAKAPLVVSVNTGTVHISAAVQTPVIVLYALTNPQHTPWNVRSSVLFYSVTDELQSKNQVVVYVTENIMKKSIPPPAPARIVAEAEKLLTPVTEAGKTNAGRDS